jgi:hypothetical protein
VAERVDQPAGGEDRQDEDQGDAEEPADEGPMHETLSALAGRIIPG